MDFNGYLSEINKSLNKYLEVSDGMNDTVVKAMKYSVMAGGKRLRPVILLNCCEIFSGGYKEALPFASAIEMIHTYSLIHDDLPALDNDDYRRGMPSCHCQFKEWVAILAGDALLNLGFQIMLDKCYEALNGQDMERRLRAFKVIADAAGVNGMISGQTGDIEWVGRTPSKEVLTQINARKTGAIISGAFEAGAVLGGASKEDIRSFALAGEKTGLAFQIKDDMLDYEGESDKLGKPCGSDEKNNKVTYITIIGHEGCAEAVKKLSGEALALIKKADGNTEFLENLINSLINRES